MTSISPSKGVTLSRMVRMAVGIAATIDVVIGFLFLLGPELNVTPWPKPISPVLMRFIGSIVLANGVGAAIITLQGTWEGARVLFTVALVYGVVILAALLGSLLFLPGTDRLFWWYAGVNLVFLVPIIFIYWSHERAH